MPLRLVHRGAFLLLALALLIAGLANVPVVHAQEGFEAKSRSSITDVGNHRFADGSPGNVGYQVSTEILEPMAPGDFFPTVRVDESEHAAAFEGQWADNGFHAAWVSQAGSSQFIPDAYTIESAYFDNYLDSGALAPGDRFDTAVKQLPFDAPLNWDRPRGEADGELEWDVATKVHRVSGTFGAHSSEMEVMFVRADLVARGGDFDSRGSSTDLPPLVIDLPRVYGPDVTVGASTAQFAPYLHYLRNVEGQVVGQSGKAIFTGDMTGYLPEAREHTIPGGTTIREWHIPLDIIITAVGRTGEVGGRSAISMPADGVVKTFGALGNTVIRAPAGATVITGNGIAPEVKSTDETPTALASPADAESSGAGSLLHDIKQLAPLDASLNKPASVRVAKRSYDLTFDPDLHGSGMLGITAVGDVRSRRDLLAATTAPSVEVDGRAITLDRSRLVELRAVPQSDTIRLRFTARSEGNALLDPSSYSRAREGRIHDPGVQIEAVYELGEGLYAFFTATSLADSGDHAQFDTWLTIRSVTGEPRHLKATQYLETAGIGPYTYDGAPITNELSGPTRPIAGDRIAHGGNATGGGVVTIKEASDAVLLSPVADPAVDLTGRRLAIYLTSQNGTFSDFYISYLSTGVSDVASSPRFPVPAIGETCMDPPVVDATASDASADLDIQSAWFDYDGAHVYATLEIAELTRAMLSPARYRVGWRYDHIGYGLQAARDATGEWAYDLGLHPSAGSQWSRIATATGEVVYGTPGFIRMKAPAQTTLAAPFFDGEVFRDTGAVTYGPTTLGEGVADRAPGGAPETAYGHGEAWRVQPCPGVEIPTTLELLDTPYQVQHSDRLVVRSLLSDDGGPIAGAPVTVSFAGQSDTVETDASGVAEAAFVASAAPGSHDVTANYGGGGARLASAASAVAEVVKEDSIVSLAVEGTGSKRRLAATLVDADDAAGAIDGRTIQFYADTELIGTAVTNEDGVASLDAPPRFRGGTHLFQAVFDGDAWFLGSRANST